jgi:hypothetical protein
MTTALGRNVKVEVALTYSAAKTVTAVTLASPGVATSSAHGLTNGQVGYWTVTGGMPQLDGQASRVYNQTANTFDIQGLNTAGYTAFTAGTFTPVATWGSLGESIGFNIGGGAADTLDDTRLSDVIKQEILGLLAADSVTLDTLPQTVNSAAMQSVIDASIAQTYQVYRITLHDGSVWVFRGLPSRPGMALQRGQLATGSLQIKVKGFALLGAA